MREQTDRQQPPVVQAATEGSILTTPETALAAYLLVKGRRLDRIEDQADRMLSFIFADVAPGDVQAFHGGDLVRAIDFAKASAKIHQIVRARRVERHTLRQRSPEPEVPVAQKERVAV